MKQKRFGNLFFLLLLLLVLIASPVCAFEDYGKIYDATGKLDQSALRQLSDVTLTELSNRYGVEARVDIVTDTEGRTLSEYAQIFYDKYEYGYGSGSDGVLLMVLLHEDDTGLSLDQYTLCYGGDAASIFNDEYRHTLETALDIYFTSSAWSGDLSADNESCVTGLNAFASVLDNILGSVMEPLSAGEETADVVYFRDEVGYLSNEELKELNDQAASFSAQHQCGIYGMIVADYRDYNSESVYEAAKTIFNDSNFGYGEDRDGVFLLLSMDDRDYSLIAHGDKGNESFTDYGKEALADEFLDNFGDNDFYGGFCDYVATSGKYLSLAEAGTPYDVGSSGSSKLVNLLIKVALVFVLPLVIAFFVCSMLKKKMITAVAGSSAEAYLDQNGINFSAREDQFSHITEVITEIPDSDKGGTSVDSGGFSGRSGKF